MIQDASSALDDYETNGDSNKTGIFFKLRAVGDVCIENNDIHSGLKNRIDLTKQYNFKMAALALREVHTLSGGRNNNQGLRDKLVFMKAELAKISEKELAAIPTETISGKKKENNDKIFIVHGHDELAKSEAARFVDSLGLKAVILHEQINQSQTIIEKFEKHASEVAFAVVLLTADDVGYAKDNPDSAKFRARQNVIFELGYFSAALTRQKVCVLYKEGVEIPNDFAGVIYTPMDNSGGWQLILAKEMKASGLSIDLNRVI